MADHEWAVEGPGVRPSIVLLYCENCDALAEADVFITEGGTDCD